MRAFFLGLLALVAAPAFAWDDTGHMTVAQIAYNHLTPEVKARVRALLADNPAPDFTDFVRSGTYPDQLKRYGIKAYSNWHSIGTPLVRDGATPGPVKTDNVLWAIDQCTSAIRNPKCPEFERARMLRFLIHLVGDIHMPLHAASLYNADHPNGDDGGREFRLGSDAKKDRMHASWDASFGVFHDIEDTRNVDLTDIKALALSFEKALPIDMVPQANDEDPSNWAKESYSLADSRAYTTPEGQVPSAAYIEEAKKVCQARVTLAGYRLAHLVNSLFGSQQQK